MVLIKTSNALFCLLLKVFPYHFVQTIKCNSTGDEQITFVCSAKDFVGGTDDTVLFTRSVGSFSVFDAQHREHRVMGMSFKFM